VEGGKTNKLGIWDKTVLIEKSGARYAFTVEEGGLPLGKTRAVLDNEFNKIQDDVPLKELLPGRPVPLEGTWDIPAKRVAPYWGARMGMLVDVNKSKASGRLAKVKEEESGKKGIVEIKITLVPRGLLVGPA